MKENGTKENQEDMREGKQMSGNTTTVYKDIVMNGGMNQCKPPLCSFHRPHRPLEDQSHFDMISQPQQKYDGSVENLDQFGQSNVRGTTLTHCLLSQQLLSSYLVLTQNSLTRFSTSDAVANPFLDSSIGKAIFISSTITTLLIICSAYSGHATIGTPAHTASSTQFHPH